MPTEDLTRVKNSGATERRIAGPIHEFDRFDRPTGATYYRCRACGAESLRRIDLEGCCDNGGA